MADTGRKRPVEVLTEDEMRRLLAACSRKAPTGIRDRALMTVMWAAGLRVSEALALRPADIDHQRGTIRVLHGKGDKARTVGIDPGGLAVIDVWLAERKRLGVNGRSVLFCTLAGGPLSPEQAWQMVKRRAKKAQIEKRVHPHALRHTFASELADEGTPVNVIQKALGHSTLSTTSIYLDHIAPTTVIDAMKARRHYLGDEDS
jgi:integrase/recombinase XerD